jgi:hypothetical protein
MPPLAEVVSPQIVRLEYLTPDGWVLAGEHALCSLLFPERYPERLREHGKFGRATLLDDRLQPTDTVWVAEDVPADPSVLVHTGIGSVPWKLPEPDKTCPLCEEEHPKPWDGGCLL